MSYSHRYTQKVIHSLFSLIFLKIRLRYNIKHLTQPNNKSYCKSTSLCPMAMVHSSVYRTIKRHITYMFLHHMFWYIRMTNIYFQTKSISFQHWSNFTTKKGNSLVCWRNLNSKGGLWIKFTTLQGSACSCSGANCNSTKVQLHCICSDVYTVQYICSSK